MSNPRHMRRDGEGPSTEEIQKVTTVAVRREQQAARLIMRYVEACDHEKTGHPKMCSCHRITHDVIYELINSDPPPKEGKGFYCLAEKAAKRRRNKIIQAVHGERPGVVSFHERNGLFPWFSIIRYPEREFWKSDDFLGVLYSFLNQVAIAAVAVEDKALEAVIIRIQHVIEAVLLAHEQNIDLEKNR